MAPILGRSLFVAIVLGSVMNLIEQGSAMLAGGPIDFLRFVLTYVMLFLASLCGALGAMALIFRSGG